MDFESGPFHPLFKPGPFHPPNLRSDPADRPLHRDPHMRDIVEQLVIRRLQALGDENIWPAVPSRVPTHGFRTESVPPTF